MAQLFIIDEAVIDAMIEEAKLKPDDIALEIGAGTGFLTRELQKHCKVIAVELDYTLCELLENELPKENLSFICGDFLETELPSFNKIVSLVTIFMPQKTDPCCHAQNICCNHHNE